jgi:hypothetical protein
MGNKPTKVVAESTCDIEGITITIICFQDETGWLSYGYHIILAGNERYKLKYRGSRPVVKNDAQWNELVSDIKNNKYTAKFEGGNLHLICSAGNLTLPGVNAKGNTDPTYNATILTCYRTQNK